MNETVASAPCHICGHVNEAGSRFCTACRAGLASDSSPLRVAHWRARARLRRTIVRATAAGLVLFATAWVAVENVGLTRFLPAPASNLTSERLAGDWPTEGGSPLRSSAAPGDMLPLRGEVAWEVDMGTAGASVALAGRALYVGTTAGSVRALSASNGAPLWDAVLGAPVSATPSVAGSLVYTGLLDGRVVGLNRESGDLSWSFQTGGPVRSSPAVVGGVLYAGSDDRRLYAIDALTGEERWNFATGGRITSGPAVNEQLVIVAAQDNLIHFIDRRTAKRWFDYDIGLADGSAAIAQDSVYAADSTGTIRRVRWDNREWPLEKALRNVRRWMFRWGMSNELPPAKGVVWAVNEAGESFSGTPAVDAERVYASTTSGKVLAFDRQTGAGVWRADLGSVGARSPIVRGEELVVGTSGGLLVTLDADTGAERWRLGLRTGVAHDIAVGQDAVYVLEAGGVLLGIR